MCTDSTNVYLSLTHLNVVKFHLSKNIGKFGEEKREVKEMSNKMPYRVLMKLLVFK